MDIKKLTDRIISKTLQELYPTKITRSMTRFLVDYYKNHDGLVGVEIGVFKGNNAYNILSSLNIKKLYLIDPYVVWYDPEGKKDYSSYESYARDILGSFQDRVVFVKKLSSDAYRMFDDNSLDFVYIDGCMRYDVFRLDIENYLPKLRVGGVLGGHNFVAGWESVDAVLEVFGNDGLMGGEDNCWWVIKTDKKHVKEKG